MRNPTTGLEPVDELIGGLHVGDNVVLQTVSDEAVQPVLSALLGTVSGREALLYVSFGHPPSTVLTRFGDVWDAERFVLLDCRPQREPEEAASPQMRIEWPSGGLDPAAVSRALLRIGSDLGPGVCYVIDGLADVARQWNEAAAFDLFLSTCPGLYQLRTIAYWALDPAAFSRRFLVRLEQITQVMLDIRIEEAEQEEFFVEVRKASGRPIELRGGRLHAVVEDDQLRVLRQTTGRRRSIGELVRQRREALGLSQAELARRVGITPSALSQAERGARGFSGEVLTRVWGALDVPFGPQESMRGSPMQVFRRGRTGESLRNRLATESLVDTSGFDVRVVRFPPNVSGSGPLFPTKTRELVVVLDGVLELRVGQTNEVLHAGDATLIAEQPLAAWSNLGTSEARALWMLVP